RQPSAQVVALTASTDDARLVGVLRAGGIGYVRKDAEPELLLATVRAAAHGQSMIDPTAAAIVLHEVARGGQRHLSPGGELTERETEVLRHLGHGRTNREIAEALFISEETVKTHIGNILGKLHLAHRTQAVVYALKEGLISLDELKL
ncbi:MAG: response regulator transcription factor, partial [Acidobacteriota bacterium]|nr:response regulator transcription factor [Acidobacteriota bacterium]